MSRVFFARSLTNGRAMTGMRSEAGTWPFSLFMRYGTDMVAAVFDDEVLEERIGG